MVIINVERLKNDIPNEKYEQFLEQFPDLKDHIDQFKKKPTCGVCFKSAVGAIVTHPAFGRKMMNIYGDDASIDQGIAKLREQIVSNQTSHIAPSQTQQPETKMEVFIMSPDDFKEFIERFHKYSIVRFMNTLFVPNILDGDKIYVTINYIERS